MKDVKEIAMISVTLYNIYFTKRVNPDGIQWNFTLIYLNKNAIIFTYKHKQVRFLQETKT